MRHIHSRNLLTLFIGLSVAACGDSADGDSDGGDDCVFDEDHGHSHGDCDDNDAMELMNLVRLTFTPEGGGDAVVASFEDEDGGGVGEGVSEPVVLAAGSTYSLGIEVMNSLADPTEDVTPEIRDEAEQHQVFIYGTGVSGPASNAAEALVTHTYADTETDYVENTVGDDLAVGLVNTIVADTAGSGVELRVMLRHLPDVNGEPTKVAGIAEDFANGDAVGGGADIDVRFELTVE